MAIVGPRPLLVRYLDRYNEEQHHRHDVRPGLTGYAQAHGRNAISWEDKFAMDVWYTKHITFLGDIKILIDTVMVVFKRSGVSSETSATIRMILKVNILFRAIKRILTGAAGFIGSNLVMELVRMGKSMQIIGIDNMNDYYDVSIKEYRLG